VKFLTGVFGAFSGFVLLLHQGKRNSSQDEDIVSPKCLNDAELGRHSTAIVKGTKLHYVEQGDNTNKCILCLHDFGDFWYGWRNQLRGLCENFWVVALDLKGFGESEKPVFQGGYDEEVILEEIRAFILTIIEGHEDQKIILIGHGLGGSISWKFVERYPEMVDKLILISAPHPDVWLQEATSTWKNILENRWLYASRVPFIPEWKLLESKEQFFNKRFNNWEKLTDVNFYYSFNQDAYEYTFARASDWRGPVNYYRNLSLETVNIQDIGDDRSSDAGVTMALDVETLLLVGNVDSEVSLDLITRSSMIPTKCAVHIINGAGHFPHQEQPSYCNKIIYRFIEDFDKIKLKEKEDKNNNVGDTEIENVGLVQKSLNTIKKYVSSEKLDQIEEIELDNSKTVMKQNNSSIYQMSIDTLKNYGNSFYFGYKQPIDKVMNSGSNVLSEGAATVANNMFRFYFIEQYQ